MKPEALDAFATKTTRPGALEAATNKMPDTNSEERKAETMERKDSHVSNEATDAQMKPAISLIDEAEGTSSTAKMIEEAVQGVRSAVQGVVSWTEKKADDLTSKEDVTGPYASPATCAVSDLDPIASGILPAAIPSQNEDEKNSGGKINDGGNGEIKDEKERRA